MNEDLEQEWRQTLPEDTAMAFPAEYLEWTRERIRTLKGFTRQADREFLAPEIERLQLLADKLYRKIQWEKRPKKDQSLDKERAKEAPITDLLSFNRAGFTKCLWHDEKSPSLKHWKTKNLVHCFGCDKTYDSIDVAMKLWGVSFVEAVKRLTNT